MHCCWCGPTAEIASGYCITPKAPDDCSSVVLCVPCGRSFLPQRTQRARGRGVMSYISTGNNTKNRDTPQPSDCGVLSFLRISSETSHICEVHLEPLACFSGSHSSRRGYCTNCCSSIDSQCNLRKTMCQVSRQDCGRATLCRPFAGLRQIHIVIRRRVAQYHQQWKRPHAEVCRQANAGRNRYAGPSNHRGSRQVTQPPGFARLDSRWRLSLHRRKVPAWGRDSSTISESFLTWFCN